jgi:hypothetical protein
MAEVLLLLVSALLTGYAVLTWAVYRRTRAIFLLVAMVFTGAWSLLGAIPLLWAKLDDSQYRATYLEGRLYVVRPDSDYLTVIVSYGAFLLILASVLLVLAPRISANNPLRLPEWRQLAARFPHTILLAIVFVALVLQWSDVTARMGGESGQSLYLSGQARLDRLSTYLSVGSTIAASLGFALLLVSNGFRRKARAIWISAYLGLLLGLYYLTWILGHRRLMLVAVVGLLVAVLTLRESHQRSRGRQVRVAFIWIGAWIGFVLVSVTGVTRSKAIGPKLADNLGVITSTIGDVGSLVTSWLGTAELYAAHMSLYGVIANSDRIDETSTWAATYSRYSEIVHAPSDQGFTLHQVTGWWLVVGPFAPLVAGLFVALLVLVLLRVSRSSPLASTGAFALPALSVSALSIPSLLMRGGPESAWGLLLETLLLPGAVLFVPWLVALKRVRADEFQSRTVSGHCERGHIAHPHRLGGLREFSS